MTVEIYKKFCFAEKLLFPFLEVPHNTHYLWKKLSSVGLLIDVPVTIEVKAQHASPIVT